MRPRVVRHIVADKVGVCQVDIRTCRVHQERVIVGGIACEHLVDGIGGTITGSGTMRTCFIFEIVDNLFVVETYATRTCTIGVGCIICVSIACDDGCRVVCRIV